MTCKTHREADLGSRQRHIQTGAVPPGADKKVEPGLSQQPNSSLEADLVVDVVNYLSKVGEIYFVLNKLVIRKKKIL